MQICAHALGLVEVALNSPMRVGKQTVTLYIDARPAGGRPSRRQTLSGVPTSMSDENFAGKFTTPPGSSHARKLLWDASALIAVISISDAHHQAAYELWVEHREVLSIFPALAWFEYQAAANRLESEGTQVTRFIYMIPGRTRVLPIDDSFIQRCTQRKLIERFKSLRGADLVYACAAALERATLVTFDQKLKSAFGWDTLP
jgi:predicted nucleic acid-binding protein